MTPPTGATINATTGAFSWTPAAAGTFSVKVRVTDNGSPILYDDEIVTVTVTASLIGIAAPGEPGRRNRAGRKNNEKHDKHFSESCT